MLIEGSLAPNASAQAHTSTAALDRAALLLLVITIPLHWIPLSHVSAGTIRWAHLACAIALLIAASRYRAHLRALMSANSFLATLVVLYALMTTIGALASSQQITDGIQQLGYFLIALGPAVLLRRAVVLRHTKTLRLLSRAALYGSISFIIFFALASGDTGFQVFERLWTSLDANDRNSVLFKVFRTSVGNSGGASVGARANSRHEIFIGLAVLTWVSVVARGSLRGLNKGRDPLGLVGIALACSLIMASLSRSSLASIVLPPLLLLVPRLRTGAGRDGRLRIVAILMSLTAFVMSPLPRVLAGRVFSDTSSYTSRTQALRDALLDVGGLNLVGAHPAAASLESSHNFVIETGLRSGIIALTAALALQLWLLSHLLREIRLYINRQDAVSMGCIGLLTLANVRMLTAGSGKLTIAGWLAIAIYLALRSGELPSTAGTSSAQIRTREPDRTRMISW